MTFDFDPCAAVGRRVMHSEVRIGDKVLSRNATYTLAAPDFLLQGKVQFRLRLCNALGARGKNKAVYLYKTAADVAIV